MVSVITVTYNAEKWIEATIRSVLAQTCTDYEYLIIDGASVDGTVALAKKFEPDFQGRLQIISEPDNGIYDAMNKGLRKAKGDFVWFVNAGDRVYAPDTLQAISEYIGRGVDIIYGKASIIDDSGRQVSEHHKKTPAALTRKSLLDGMVVCHQAILVRRTIAPLYDVSYRICSDYDWVVRCVSSSDGNRFIDNYICKFLTQGLSRRYRKLAWLERFRIMRRHYGLLLTLLSHLRIIIRYPFSIKY
ncbi:MAG: glycosyltransferase [Bacteroidales bacterium]|nr:glycosyltransferase [Bacteroidales bacterium]